jgi:hypothetical protein
MPSGKFLSSAEHRSRVNRSNAPRSNSTVVMLSTFSWRPDPSSALERWTSAAPQAGISDRRKSLQENRRCDLSGLTIGRCALSEPFCVELALVPLSAPGAWMLACPITMVFRGS